MRGSLVVVLMLAAAPLAAQQGAHTVSPGMTRVQVTTALGAAATVRTVSDYTYMFYQNSCGKRCGMNDLVILHGDSVVDAIFRSPNRHYTGTSSSPAPIPPSVAAKQNPSSPGQPLKIKPGPANDTRPSIPVNRQTVTPAPGSKPAPASKPATTKPPTTKP
jgi:hypothetical protein